MAGTVPFGCGQCLPCRINRARQWQWRQVLESFTHEECCFVTLTYNDESLPADGSLVPVHLQLFLKRLRKSLHPTPLRFFAVGEYGEHTHRPHYHLSLFGMSGLGVYLFRGGHATGADIIEQNWGHGFTYTAEFTTATARYVTGYVVKKLKDYKNPALTGLVPEFARMSNRPGIGANAMVQIARDLKNEHGQNFMDNEGDIPKNLRIGGQKIPLPRYLIAKLRQAVGFTEEQIAEIKQASTFEKSLEMLALYANAGSDPLNPTASFKKAYLFDVEQKIRNLEAKARLRTPRRTL